MFPHSNAATKAVFFIVLISEACGQSTRQLGNSNLQLQEGYALQIFVDMPIGMQFMASFGAEGPCCWGWPGNWSAHILGRIVARLCGRAISDGGPGGSPAMALEEYGPQRSKCDTLPKVIRDTTQMLIVFSHSIRTQRRHSASIDMRQRIQERGNGLPRRKGIMALTAFPAFHNAGIEWSTQRRCAKCSGAKCVQPLDDIRPIIQKPACRWVGPSGASLVT